MASAVAAVAHLDLVLEVLWFVEQIGVELGHFLTVVVLIVFAVEHLLIEVLAFYESTVHRLQLLHDDILLYHYLRHRSHEEENHQCEHHRKIGDALILPSCALDLGGAAYVDNEYYRYCEDLSKDDEDVVSDFSVSK